MCFLPLDNFKLFDIIDADFNLVYYYFSEQVLSILGIRIRIGRILIGAQFPLKSLTTF